MNRRQARTVALALLAVVVAGVAAATISTSVPGSGLGASDADQSGSGGERPTEEDDDRVLPEISFEFDHSLDASRQNEGEDDGAGGDDGGGNGGDAALNPQSPTGVAALVGAVVLVGLAFLVRSRGEDGDDRDDETEADDETVEQVRRVAGEAADRIETDAHADPDNEVYRAWRELTTHLDVADPRTSTPGEFAAAAVAAGVDREAVSELTAVFRGVRYGGRTPTDERERRAVEALRRIERREESDADGRRGESDDGRNDAGDGRGDANDSRNDSIGGLEDYIDGQEDLVGGRDNDRDSRDDGDDWQDDDGRGAGNSTDSSGEGSP